MIWTPNHFEKVSGMFLNMAKVHKGDMESMYLNWEVMQIYHPRYEEKIDQPVPLVVIDFK